MVLNLVGLTISVPEFIWTILNFFLLAFLLNTFLYKPVLKHTDARQAKIDAGLEEGKTAEKALAESLSGFDAELTKSGAEAREKLGAARSSAEKAKSEVLSAAHAEAANIRKDVYARIEAEKAEAEKSVGENMPELVILLTKQLLQCDDVSEAEELVGACIHAAKE